MVSVIYSRTSSCSLSYFYKCYREVRLEPSNNPDWSSLLQRQEASAAFGPSSPASTRSSCARFIRTPTQSCAAPSASSWWRCWTSTWAATWPSWPPCSSRGPRGPNRSATTTWRWSTASAAPSCWHRSVSLNSFILENADNCTSLVFCTCWAVVKRKIYSKRGEPGLENMFQ